MLEGATMVSVVGVIPARGGSKSIPRKNVRVFLGKPLLAWTIEATRESGVFDRLVLSTDDAAIAETGRRLGAEAPALRPKELAQDTSPTAPAVKHILQVLQQQGGVADIVVILEPTSPGRRPFHLREVVELMLSSAPFPWRACRRSRTTHCLAKEAGAANERFSTQLSTLTRNLVSAMLGD